MTFRDPNRAIGGQAYGLTVIAPIRPGHEAEVRATLAGLAEDRSPFASVPSTHVARLGVIDRVSADTPQRRRRLLRFEYLLFSAVFDGDFDTYVRLLCRRIPDLAEALWGHCLGAPRPVAAEPEAFRDWLAHNRIRSSAFFAPYGEATVEEIRSSLALHRRAQRFATRSQYWTARQLAKGFADEFLDPATGALR